tara:strand:- start:56705 stop:58093 length:1389 start_codon:yes stop_codon:yes gene_type:complete
MPITTDEIAILVDTTYSDIKNNFIALMPPVDERKIFMACDNPIRSAFKAAKSGAEGESNKKKLYYKLSSKFHQDKLSSRDHELTVQLDRLSLNKEDVKLKFIPIPQQIINSAYYNNDDFSEVMTSMASKPSQTMNQLYKQIIEAVTPIYNEYMRYPEPIRSIVKYTRLMIFAGIAITSLLGSLYVADLFLGELVLALMTSHDLGNRLTDVRLLNFITNDQYGNELDKNITRERMAGFAREKLIILHGIDAYEETDEAAITLYIDKCINLYQRANDTLIKSYQSTLDSCNNYLNQPDINNTQRQANEKIRQETGQKLATYRAELKSQNEEKLKHKIKEDVTGMECLYATLNAFIHEITKPFSGDLSSNLISGAVRVLLALLLLPCLMIQAVQQILNPVVSALFLVTAAIAAVPCLAVLFVSNIPLYIYDAVTEVSPHMNAFFQPSNHASSVDACVGLRCDGPC